MSRASAAWGSVEVAMSKFSFASTIGSTRCAGRTSQPTRSAGERVLEKLPQIGHRVTKPLGAILILGGLVLAAQHLI